jgi:hypothetical protein
VLTRPHGQKLTPGFITDQLQGKTTILRTGNLRQNICNNEMDLQAAVDNLPLGRRLHRLCGAGGKTDASEGEDNYCAILFILSFKLTAMDTANRRIQLNGHWLYIVHYSKPICCVHQLVQLFIIHNVHAPFDRQVAPVNYPVRKR